MVPFNTYSVFDLAGVIVTTPLVVIFYVVYWKFGRHLLDLLFANLMLCGAAACFCWFAADNIVPAGAAAATVPNAASETAVWFRAGYGVGLVAMPTQLHFFLAYRHVRKWLTWRVAVVYAVFLLSMPVICSEAFLTELTEPVADVGSWSHVVPWMPNLGPVGPVYMGLWLAVQILSVVLLCRGRRSMLSNASGGVMRVGVLAGAVIISMMMVMVDMVLVLRGLYTITMVPFAVMTMGVFVAVVLLRQRVDAERTRMQMQREMELACRIQQNLLPQREALVSGFELSGWSRAATHAGGDIYDFLQLADGRMMIVLGDASGHGMGPALLIVEARALLRATVRHCREASEVLSAIEPFLSEDMGDERFVTCFVGLLYPADGEMCYASAGQGPILLYREATGQFEAEEAATCPPLGQALLDSHPSEDRRWQFQPGDFLALASDGFFEATNQREEEFGIGRLKESLLRCRHLRGREMVEQVRGDLAAFVGSGRQQDDMTMVILRKL